VRGQDKDNHKNLPKIDNMNAVNNECYTNTKANFFEEGSVKNFKYDMMQCEFYGRASTPLPCRQTFDGRISYVNENRLAGSGLNDYIKSMLTKPDGDPVDAGDETRQEIEYIWARYYDPAGPINVPEAPEEVNDISEEDSTVENELVEVTTARHQKSKRRQVKRSSSSRRARHVHPEPEF